VNVPFTQSTLRTITSCTCQGGASVAICAASQSGTLVTFALTIVNGGVCVLRDQTNAVYNIALVRMNFLNLFLGELSLNPVAGQNGTNTPLQVVATPPVVFSQFLRGMYPFLTPVLNPSLRLNSTAQSNFTFTQSVKDALLPALQFIDNKYEVEFALNDGNDVYPIQTPFIMYPSASISSISPTLVRGGSQTTFTIKTPDYFVPGTKIIKIDVGGTQVDGILIDTQTVQFTFTFSTAQTGNQPFRLSFDGLTWKHNPTLGIWVFNFPTIFNPLFPSNGLLYPSEVGQGCSIFGFNNVIFPIFPEVSSGERAKFAPLLRINTGQITRQTACAWDSLASGINCTCISFFDFKINLPQTWTFELQLNGQDWLSTGGSITYFALEPYVMNQVSKLDQSPLGLFTVSTIKNRYDPARYSYGLFLRNKANANEVSVTSFCNIIPGPTYNCSDIPFLNSATNLATSDSRLNDLCGCKFEIPNCPGGTIVGGTQCCVSGSCTTITTVPFCQTPCDLNFVMKIGSATDSTIAPVDHESIGQLKIFVSVSLSTFTPNAVPRGTTPSISWTGGIFTNYGGFQTRFNQQPNDPQYRRIIGCVVDVNNNCSDPSAIFTHAPYFASAVTQVSTTAMSMTAPNIANEGLFDVFFTMNAVSFQRITNFPYRVYDPSRFNFTFIQGDSGIGQTTPAGSNMTINGENFFPSSRMLVRYVSSLTLTTTCTFTSRNAINCLTVNAFSSGITLPSVFGVEFAPNGIDFINTGLNITYLKSDIPVIVQLIPQRGPINPEEGPYPITVKGITPAGVSQCVFISPNKTLEFISDVSSFSTDQVICNVPTQAITTGPGRYQVSIRNPNTLVQSDPTNAYFDLYTNPVITTITPNSGPAIGGVQLTLGGTGFNISVTGYQIRFKLGDTQTSTPCTLISDTSVTCMTPSHPENPALKVYISYNENQFASSNSTYQSLACLAGFSAKDFETPCQPCKSGFFKPSIGFFDCIPCGTGTFQGLTGASACNLCPARTSTIGEGSVFVTQCDCTAGSYRKNNTLPGIECSECPDGGICLGRDNFPAPRFGWWWNRAGSPMDDWKFEKCDVPDWCTGNVTLNDGCLIGRTNFKCVACVFGYYKSGTECLICDNDIRWRMVLIVIVIVILMFFVFKFAQLKVSHLSSISIAMSYYQIIAVFSAYNFKWPPELKEALGILKFLNFDLDIFVPECISEITWGMKWYATLALPIIFALVMIIGFLLETFRALVTRVYGPWVHEKLGDKVFKCDVGKPFYLKPFYSIFIAVMDFFFTTRTNREIWQFMDSVIHSYVIILSFSYVFVITKASQIFNCARSEPAFLLADTRYICWQGDWWVYFPFAVITLGVFGGGVLVLFAYIACNRKKALTSRTFNARFRFLFIRFRDERIYWEVVIILRNWLFLVPLFSLWRNI
jgi:hypothetical protein